jgi:hypothetical protein
VTTKLKGPYATSLVTVPDGAQLPVNADGTIDAPDQYVADLVQIGYSVVADVAVDATTGRPTANLVAGMMFFDSTLGKPIWRNAANSGWVDATGASV